MLDYPHDFPPAARARVERAIGEATFSVGSGNAVLFVRKIFDAFLFELTETATGQDTRPQDRLTAAPAFLNHLIEQVFGD